MPYAEIADQFERRGDAGGVDLRDNEHGIGTARQELRDAPERSRRFQPGAGQLGQGIVDGRVGAQDRNLDRPDAQTVEIDDGVFRQKRTVGQHVDVAAFEARLQGEVMDIAQQQRLAAGEGDRPDDGLRQEAPERLAGHRRIGSRQRRTAVAPIIVTEPATLVAGFRQFIDQIVDMQTLTHRNASDDGDGDFSDLGLRLIAVAVLPDADDRDGRSSFVIGGGQRHFESHLCGIPLPDCE